MSGASPQTCVADWFGPWMRPSMVDIHRHALSPELPPEDRGRDPRRPDRARPAVLRRHRPGRVAGGGRRHVRGDAGAGAISMLGANEHSARVIAPLTHGATAIWCRWLG